MPSSSTTSMPASRARASVRSDATTAGPRKPALAEQLHHAPDGAAGAQADRHPVRDQLDRRGGGGLAGGDGRVAHGENHLTRPSLTYLPQVSDCERRTRGDHAADPGGRLGRLPRHDRDADRRRRRRRARARGPAHGRRVRLRGHRGRGGRARAPARRRPRRRAERPAPRHRRRRPHRRLAATCASRSTPHPDDEPVDGKTRNLEREYRAVVEEILELRGDDGRISAFLRSITEPGALADTSRLLARHLLRGQGRPARDPRRDRAPGEGAQAPARAPHRAAGAPPDPRRRPVGRRQAAARVLPAQADGVDPQGARRRRRARSPRSTARRSRRPACPRPCASRPRRSSTGSSAWASSRARAR